MSGSIGVDDHFTLEWNDYHRHLLGAFSSLRTDRDFVDLTLSCEGGRKLNCHKMLLSACSPYFRGLLRENPHPHPIIILRQTSYEDLVAIIQFIYHGEVSLHQSRVKSFIKTAKTLKIRGLCDANDLSASELTTTSGQQHAMRAIGGDNTPRKRKKPPTPNTRSIKPKNEPADFEQDDDENWEMENSNNIDDSVNLSQGENTTLLEGRKQQSYPRKFNDKWLENPDYQLWLRKDDEDNTKAWCTACDQRLTAKEYDIKRHLKTPKHQKRLSLSSTEAGKIIETALKEARVVIKRSTAPTSDSPTTSSTASTVYVNPEELEATNPEVTKTIIVEEIVTDVKY